MKEKLIENIQETVLTVISSDIRSVLTKNITKTACRVYDNGKIGIAGNIGETDEKELYSKAEQNLRYQIDYPVEPTKNIKSHIRIDSCKISNYELYSESEKILKELSRLHPDFSVNNYIYLKQRELSMENELGMDLSYFDRYINFLVFLKPKSFSNDMAPIFYYRSRELEPEKILEASSEIISAHSNPLPLPKESLPLVFVHNPLVEIFSQDLTADVLGTGSSLFQHQIGKEVFSKNFSLKIENNPIENYSEIFDREGTITPENISYLIKDGVIIRPYSDKRTAKLYGYENTGCGRCKYNSVPTLVGGEACIQPGNKTLKELLNGQNGIVVYLAGGGDFTPDGNFASPVQISYLTDGEKLLGRLPNYVIKGSVYDIFGKNYIGMSKDKKYALANCNLLVTRMDIKPL